MHDHREILGLAAAAIDFELDPAEGSRLRAALEECSLCRRQASALRATATVLSRPLDIGTPGRVRDVVVGAALRRNRPALAMRSLLAASLAIFVVLGGTVFVAGNRGFGLFPATSPSASIPSPTAVAQASPSVAPTPAPQPTPAPTAQSTPTETAPVSTPPADEGLLRPGDIAAMISDGRLVIRTLPQVSADSAIFKTRIYPGQRVVILEGPVEASGYPWYRIRLGDIEGWAAAAGIDGEPWLAPVRSGRIAFVRDAGDGSGEAIYTIDADGRTGESRLFADPNLSGYRQLTWSPDGRRLAFVATPSESNGSSEIYAIASDGSNLVRITQNDVDDDSPAWSPDGTRLALRVDNIDPSSPGDSNVVVTPIDGPGVTILGPGANPVWSPDGARIAMTAADGGTSRIWIQAADGGRRRQVTDISVASSPPSWSPDGQRIVFASSGLFLVEVATGSITQLTMDPGAMPAWSIAGTIAFATPGSASPGLFVIDADGSGLKRVSVNLDLGDVPIWAPDGRRLLFGSDVARSMVATVDPASGRLSEVGVDNATGRSPAWQPLLP